MAAATSVTVSQEFFLVVTKADSDLYSTQAVTIAAGARPAEEAHVSNAVILSGVKVHDMLDASQVVILVAATGRVSDPNLRVWTCTIDGHDFVVFRLGNEETLVYDTHSDQWSTWGSGSGNLWRCFSGVNWQGASGLAASYGSNVIVGDDGNGAIYFLNPDGVLDDDAEHGADNPQPFTRIAQGQLISHGYDRQKVFGVTLRGDIGQQSVGSQVTVTMSYSDDNGVTYNSAGSYTAEATEYDTRLNWRSLGSIKYPGRLFKIQDDGALARIDSLDVDLGEENGTSS